MTKEKYDLEVYYSGMVAKMAMFASRPIIITKYTRSIGDVRSYV